MSRERSSQVDEISQYASGMLSASMSKPENLRDWVRRKLAETGYSHAKVSERARRQGHQLSTGYVNNLAQGDADNPSAKLMEAIAAGFGVPVEEVISVVFGKALANGDFSDPLFESLARAYKDLPPAVQKEKKVLIEMLVREIQREL
jgi:transcriptional regulator with XRE-family HTH domain